MTLGLGVLGSPSPPRPVSTSGIGTGTSSSTDGTVFTTTDTWTYLESHIVVTCDTHAIKVTIPSPDAYFSGMVYPQVSERSCLFVIFFSRMYVCGMRCKMKN